MRPTWADVSLKNLRRNFQCIRRHVGANVVVCAVVKTDGYGHGAVECARALEEEGATWLGVTSTEEGVRLRDAGIASRILLMTGYWQGEEEAVVTHQLTPAVWEPWHVHLLAKALSKLGHAPLSVHVKVDTGMARLGIDIGSLPEFLRTLRSASNLVLEGVFTHLASAQILEAPDVLEQIRCFEEVQNIVLRAGFSPLYFHMANSAALATRRVTWKNMVRPGLSLYGYYIPFVSNQSPLRLCLPVAPVLSWKTRIISLRRVGANQPIGYDGAYVTTEPAQLAILPVGYADGLSRQLSSRGRAIVRDTYAPMVGNIAMDITVLDVTRVKDISLGDEVTLIGATEHCSIPASEHADLRGTIPQDVLCGIGKRVPRQYVY
jgi:alanine racemase